MRVDTVDVLRAFRLPSLLGAAVNSPVRLYGGFRSECLRRCGLGIRIPLGELAVGGKRGAEGSAHRSPYCRFAAAPHARAESCANGAGGHSLRDPGGGESLPPGVRFER